MKNIIKIALLLAVMGSYGQTTTKNYIKETTRRTASVNTGGGFVITPPANTHISTTTYYDGLGRPVQIVDQNSSPEDNKNIVTHIEYEKNIGQTKEYLPFLTTGYTTTSSGGSFPIVTTTYKSDFVTDAKPQTLSFYETYNEWTPNPYSENRKEASPRKRVLETGFPGEPWAASIPSYYEASGWEASDWEAGNLQENRNTIRTSYALNNNNEVKRYTVTTSFTDGAYKNNISENGFYPVNSLTKTVVKNENWKDGNGSNNTVEEFKDSRGNIVLKRNYNDGQAHDTYYVYNDLDLLAFVILPMANGSVLGDHLEKWCYQYNYDAKKRLIEKKLPQKDWEYIVYDKSDRVVMTGPVYNPFGDGTKGWVITKYDVFGRSVYTGYYAASTFSSSDRNTLAQNNFTIESKLGSNTTIDGITTRYTNTSFPTNFKLLSVNYYDNYTYPNAPTAFPTIETQTVNTAVKGQLTGSWTRVLTTASSTAGNLSYSLYDDKYRVIRSYSQNHLGGYTQVDSQLTFTGIPSKTVTYQKQNASATVLTITDVFTYDRRDRLTKQTEQIGTGSVETIVSNVYDALGVLITKNVGGTTGNLQKVDYKYNIRGWLTDINNAEMDFVDSENDLFQYKINYDRFAMQNVNLFNGNISSVWVRTKVDNSFKGYVYWYDHLNRLTQAKNMYYHRPGGWQIGQRMDDSYGEAATYDKNGNILTMKRTGELLDEQQALPVDDLTYTYNGNQLQTVTDTTNNTDGFKDGNTTGTDYFYDSFGNITQDLNKGITAVSYNHLSLPYQVTFANGGKINYTYDAAGTRLSKKVQPSGGALVTTDYVNGFQYENNVLQFFPHAEGYVKRNANNTYLYAYQYKDHLGNIRLSYADVNGNGTIQPASEILEENNYYPFGLKHKGYNEIANSNRSENAEKYKYNKKEWQDELGLNWYNYGWRNYDPAISRWLNPDPLLNDLKFTFNDNDVDEDDREEVYKAITTKLETGDGIYNTDNLNPYGYGYNNPVSFDDPDGRCPGCFIGGILGAAADYGMQVASNYMQGSSGMDAWTKNINVSSIALSAAEGALTQGGSAVRKLAVKGVVLAANNVVEVKTSNTGKIVTKTETNAKNVVKNMVVDATVNKATKGMGNKGVKELSKVGVNKGVVAKAVKSTIKASGGKVTSKVNQNVKAASKEVINQTGKTIENTAKAITIEPVSNFKGKTDEK